VRSYLEIVKYQGKLIKLGQQPINDLLESSNGGENAFQLRLADAELLAMEGITKCITVRCYYLFA
jgi:hypothetical protein